MKYSGKAFGKAAHKHLTTCKEMISHLPAVKTPSDKKHLLANLYYISGYVLECIYKFGILCAMGKGKNKLTKIELDEYGLMSHDIKTLRQIYIEASKKKRKNITNSHFSKWDVQIRYLTPDEIAELEEEKILNYLENCITTEFNDIRNEY